MLAALCGCAIAAAAVTRYRWRKNKDEVLRRQTESRPSVVRSGQGDSQPYVMNQAYQPSDGDGATQLEGAAGACCSAVARTCPRWRTQHYFGGRGLQPRCVPRPNVNHYERTALNSHLVACIIGCGSGPFTSFGVSMSPRTGAPPRQQEDESYVADSEIQGARSTVSMAASFGQTRVLAFSARPHAASVCVGRLGGFGVSPPVLPAAFRHAIATQVPRLLVPPL